MKRFGRLADTGSTPVFSTKYLFLLGMSWFRRGKKDDWTTRTAMDVIHAKHVNANDENYYGDMRLAA